MAVDPMHPMPEPHTIYQDWLDTSSKLLLDGDAERFAAMICVPLILRTSSTVTLLETPRDLLNDAHSLIDALNGQRVTDYIRLVKKCHYLDADTLEGWHTTYALSGAKMVTPPYNGRLVMRRVGDAWKVTEGDHELASRRMPLTEIKSDPGSLESTWAKAMSNISATHARAEPIYQVFLDGMAQSVNAGDFDAWAAHFQFPHDVHYDQSDHVVVDPEELRGVFDRLVTTVKDLGADRVALSTQFAEFLTDDRVVGFHDTSIVKGEQIMLGPIKSRTVLTLSQGRWLCSSITNSLSQEALSETQFSVLSTLPTMREIQERTRK